MDDKRVTISETTEEKDNERTLRMNKTDARNPWCNKVEVDPEPVTVWHDDGEGTIRREKLLFVEVYEGLCMFQEHGNGGKMLMIPAARIIRMEFR